MYPIVSKCVKKSNPNVFLCIQMHQNVAKCDQRPKYILMYLDVFFCIWWNLGPLLARKFKLDICARILLINKWNQHIDFVPEWSLSSVFQNHCLACKLSIGLTWILFFSKQIITLRKNNFSPQTQIDHRRASFVKSSQNASNR